MLALLPRLPEPQSCESQLLAFFNAYAAFNLGDDYGFHLSYPTSLPNKRAKVIPLLRAAKTGVSNC